MDAVRLGPFVFALERFAALAGVALFLLAVWWLGRRLNVLARRRLEAWSWRVLLVGFVAGRGMHVLAHWESFAGEPWRALAFWQGGFSAQAALVAAGLVSALELGRGRDILRPVALSLVLGLAGWSGVLMLRGPLEAPPPPPQIFTAIDGREISLIERDGRPLVLNLWATWCAPCRRELPMMAEVAAGHPGVDVVFANQREPAQRVGLFFASEGLQLDLVVLDDAGVLGRHYGAMGLPTTVFLDAEGRLREKHVGEISREAFAAALQRLTTAAEPPTQGTP